MILKKSLFAVFAGFILLLAALVIPSCTHDPVGIESFDTICFDTQVMPILVSSCNYCHNPNDAANYKEGFNILDPALIRDMAKTPGGPKGSKLYQIITDINGENFMPPSPNPPVSMENRTIIEVWIAQGAPNKICKKDTTVAGGI